MAKKTHSQVPLYNTIEKVEAYWNSLKPQSVPASYEEKWLTMAPFFDTVSLQNRVCVTLWNASTNRFIYAVDKTKVLGDNATRFVDEDGIDFTMANIQPDYLEAHLLMQQKGIQYCFDHSHLLPYNIVMNCDFHYRKRESYIHILQQVTVVETGKNQQPVLYLSYVYDITHIKKPLSVNLVIKTPYETVIWRYCFEKKSIESVPSITAKENAVLNCLGEGKQTKEIAKDLFISPHTVDTHRRNLLAKTNCVDTTGLVTYARMTGLI